MRAYHFPCLPRTELTTVGDRGATWSNEELGATGSGGPWTGPFQAVKWQDPAIPRSDEFWSGLMVLKLWECQFPFESSSLCFISCPIFQCFHRALSLFINYMPHCIWVPPAFDSSVASNFASAALIIIPDLVVDETCGLLQLALSL